MITIELERDYLILKRGNVRAAMRTNSVAGDSILVHLPAAEWIDILLDSKTVTINTGHVVFDAVSQFISCYGVEASC